MLSVLIVGVLIVAGGAIHCTRDTLLHDLQEYTFVLPKAPTEKYWNRNTKWNKDINGQRTIPVHNLHLGFFVFGRFNGDPTDSTINAGYYTADDELIFSVNVNCQAGTWETFAPSDADPSTPQRFESGDLEQPCADGDIFDVIFKVEQAHLMKWLFQGQHLNIGQQITHFQKGNYEPEERNRTDYIPGPNERPQGGARKAHKIQLTTTGSAVMDRFAFGRRLAWPEQITGNCSAVNEWLYARSKAPESVGASGVFGIADFKYRMECYGEEGVFYSALQSKIHPDQYSADKDAYCCCVNMKTGQLFTGDRNRDCQSLRDCRLQCVEAEAQHLFSDE